MGGEIQNPNSTRTESRRDQTQVSQADNPTLRSGAYEQPDARRTNFALTAEANAGDARQWSRAEMNATNPQLTAAISQMDKLNDAVKQRSIQPGSPEYQKALEAAVQSYVQVFQAGTPSGINQQLSAADSVMRQLNLATENGYIKTDSKAYQALLNVAQNTYRAAAQHADKDLSNPNVQDAIKAERAKVQTEAAALQGALNGKPLSAQDAQALGVNGNDPNALKQALQQRVQDDLTLEDMSRASGITHANLGLAMIRSAADLDGDAKNQRIGLGVAELKAAVAADPLTLADSNFQKHLGIVSAAAGIDAKQVAAALGQTDAPVAPGQQNGPVGAPAGIPPADAKPNLPSGTVEVWGPNHTRNQAFTNEPYALMQLAEQTNPPQLDKLRLAVQGADSINRQSLGQDMQALQSYIDQALGGANGAALKVQQDKETAAERQMTAAMMGLNQAEAQLMSGQGKTQPLAQQFPAFIQALSNARTPEELAQIANNTQNSQIKAALQSSDYGKQILGLNNDGFLDKLVKAKADKAQADAEINRLDPNFGQAVKFLNVDRQEYASSITTRKELLTALVSDLVNNGSLSAEQKNAEGTEAVRIAKELVTMNPGMVNPQNMYYAGFKQLLQPLNLTPEQVAKAAGVITDAPAAPAAAQQQIPTPSSSNLPDPLLKTLATAGGDVTKQTPAQKAAMLLDAIQKANGQMTQEQNAQFQALMNDAQAFETKIGPKLEQYRQQLQAQSTDLATKLHANQTFGPPLQQLGANGTTIDDVLGQLNNIRTQSGTELQRTGKLAGIDSLLSQIASTDQNAPQFKTLDQNLRTAMQADQNVAKYVSSTQLLKNIMDAPAVQAYQKQEQNYLIAKKNPDLVAGMWGEALLASGHPKEAQQLITAAHNSVADMMPSLENAQHLVQQALAGQPTPPGVQKTAAEINDSTTQLSAQPVPGPAAADGPPGYIAGITDDSTPVVVAPGQPTVAQPAPGTVQGVDAQTQAALNAIPGFQNMQNARAILGDTSLSVVDAVNKATPEFTAAVNAAGSVNQQQLQQFDALAKQITQAQQQVAGAEQLTAQGKPDPNPQATQAAKDILATLPQQAGVLALSTSEPAVSRMIFAKVLNDAATTLYKQADSGAANAADLRQKADAMNAKAIDLLSQIGQVDPTYGYLRLADKDKLPTTDADKQELIAKATMTVQGAIALAKEHKPFDDNSGLARALSDRAVARVNDGLTPAGTTWAQPIWAVKNLVGNTPGMPIASMVGDMALISNPFTAPAMIPFDFMTQPTMDDNHYNAAVHDMTLAKTMDKPAADAAIQQNKDSLLDKAWHIGADLLSGPTAIALASRLPLPWYVRAPLALAGTAATEKGLDWIGGNYFGTHQMTNTELALHTAGSFGFGAATNTGSLLRGIGEARMLGVGTNATAANEALAATFSVKAGNTFRETLAEANAAARSVAPPKDMGFWRTNLTALKDNVRYGATYFKPSNFSSGVTFKPFETVTRDVAGPIDAATGVATTVKQTQIAGSLADVNARLFWSRMPYTAVTGGVGFATLGAADVNPLTTKADGTNYTWSETASNAGNQFLIGTAATGIATTFLGITSTAGQKLWYSPAGQWAANTAPGRGVTKIAQGLGDLVSPAENLFTKPLGELPVVKEYPMPTDKVPWRSYLPYLKTPAVPQAMETTGWRAYAEGALNQGVKVQTAPLLMPLSVVGTSLYGRHVWSRIDEDSDDAVKTQYANNWVSFMRAQQAQQRGQ
jgi:hypothetical protein